MLMTPIKTDTATAVAAVPPREFLSTLVWIKADGLSTAGTQSVVEILAPAGWATPWHNHLTHDEYFYILEGEVTAQVGDTRVVLRPVTTPSVRAVSPMATALPGPARRGYS
jgi:uncharacterized cupin superfamily protein